LKARKHRFRERDSFPIDLLFDPSREQMTAIDRISNWFHHGTEQVFFLEGVAGSGKTTLMRVIATWLGDIHVVFAAFTGKAASVMRIKHCDGATTLHSLIYKPMFDYGCVRTPLRCDAPPCEDGALDRCAHLRKKVIGYTLNPNSPVASADLVVIDEVSMVGWELAQDLLSFGVKVLVVGDRNQLPPVEGGGYFTNREPDFMLREIHRQGAGSPIITLATKARKGEPIQLGNYGDSYVIFRERVTMDAMLGVEQIIAGTHRTRQAYNRKIRRALGRGGKMPLPGDKVVCMKNNKQLGLLNDTTWKVLSAAPKNCDFYAMTVESDDDTEEVVDVVAPADGFGRLDNEAHTLPGHPFDWGYCLTCHKAQGSQWRSVMVIDESACWRPRNPGDEDQRARWKYTAITRPSDRIIIAL
jgi:exodeoxyribonuclease-5